MASAQISLYPNKPERKTPEDVASRPVLSDVVVSHQPYQATTEHLKCSKSKLRCALSTKYTSDLVDLVQKECKNNSLTISILIEMIS